MNALTFITLIIGASWNRASYFHQHNAHNVIYSLIYTIWTHYWIQFLVRCVQLQFFQENANFCLNCVDKLLMNFRLQGMINTFELHKFIAISTEFRSGVFFVDQQFSHNISFSNSFDYFSSLFSFCFLSSHSKCPINLQELFIIQCTVLTARAPHRKINIKFNYMSCCVCVCDYKSNKWLKLSVRHIYWWNTQNDRILFCTWSTFKHYFRNDRKRRTKTTIFHWAPRHI